jgi:hypothetical protein
MRAHACVKREAGREKEVTILGYRSQPISSLN